MGRNSAAREPRTEDGNVARGSDLRRRQSAPRAIFRRPATTSQRRSTRHLQQREPSRSQDFDFEEKTEA